MSEEGSGDGQIWIFRALSEAVDLDSGAVALAEGIVAHAVMFGINAAGHALLESGKAAGIEVAFEDAVLDAITVAFEEAGDLAQAFGAADVVADDDEHGVVCSDDDEVGVVGAASLALPGNMAFAVTADGVDAQAVGVGVEMLLQGAA